MQEGRLHFEWVWESYPDDHLIELLDATADLNQKGYLDLTAAHFAASHASSTDILSFALEKGMNFHAPTARFAS